MQTTQTGGALNNKGGSMISNTRRANNRDLRAVNRGALTNGNGKGDLLEPQENAACVFTVKIWGKGCHPFPTSPWDEIVLRVRSWAGQVLRGNHLYIWWRILLTEKEWAKKSGWTISGDQKSPVGTFNVCTRILGLSFFLKPHPAVASLNKCLRHLFPTFANTKNNQWCWASKMFKLISLHRQKLVGQISYPSSNDEAFLQRI